MDLAAGLVGAAVGGFHDPGSASRGDDETVPPPFQGLRPLGHHGGQLPGVLVVAGHFHASLRAPAAQLACCPLGDLFLGRRLLFASGAGAADPGLSSSSSSSSWLASSWATEARRPEKHDGVLNALPAETRQWLGVFRDDAHQPAVGTVDKGRVLVGEGSAIEVGRFAGFMLHAFKRWIARKCTASIDRNPQIQTGRGRRSSRAPLRTSETWPRAESG